MTKLERFLERNRIKPAEVARRVNFSRKHLVDVRMGRREPSRAVIASVVVAISDIIGKPVRAEELFDFRTVERRKAS